MRYWVQGGWPRFVGHGLAATNRLRAAGALAPGSPPKRNAVITRSVATRDLLLLLNVAPPFRAASVRVSAPAPDFG